MEQHDLDEEDQLELRNYILLFLAMAAVDSSDDQLFLTVINKVARDKGMEFTFATYVSMAMFALHRLDLRDMSVDARPYEVEMRILHNSVPHVPGELADEPRAVGAVACSDFMGHVAANDLGAAFGTFDTLIDTPHPKHGKNCGCNVTAFVRTLASAALDGPLDNASFHRLVNPDD